MKREEVPGKNPWGTFTVRAVWTMIQHKHTKHWILVHFVQSSGSEVMKAQARSQRTEKSVGEWEMEAAIEMDFSRNLAKKGKWGEINRVLYHKDQENLGMFMHKQERNQWIGRD